MLTTRPTAPTAGPLRLCATRREEARGRAARPTRRRWIHRGWTARLGCAGADCILWVRYVMGTVCYGHGML